MSDSRQKFMRELRKEGFTVELTKNSHLRILHPDMQGCVIASSTPGDRHVIHNIRAEIKRRLRPRSQAISA